MSMKRFGDAAPCDERAKGQVQAKIAGSLALFQPIDRHSPSPVASRRVSWARVAWAERLIKAL
jgi:hypothetical protein